jgi:sec-independent protein translocase protein TatA
MGPIGPMEMVFLGIIALLLFGKRLPEVARSLGKGVTEFKKGLSGIEDEVDRATYNKPEPSNSSRPTPVEESVEPEAPKFEAAMASTTELPVVPPKEEAPAPREGGGSWRSANRTQDATAPKFTPPTSEPS